MVSLARKGLLACAGIAVIGGGIAGLGLANYAQSGAFDFYKQMPPPAEQAELAAPADSAGYYPVSRAAATPAYPEDPYPPRTVAIARPAEPADYRRVARIDPEPLPAVEEQAALSEPEPIPVIAPQRGSWTAPEPEAPAETTPGDTAS